MNPIAKVVIGGVAKLFGYTLFVFKKTGGGGAIRKIK
jgi:hypothetical protein